ncbi:MAG: cobalamin-dependent protein [Deltaproteobacteria bacterium]|nr:cobalamin-dependent protein [Deltaproteobacteria bacterium]
MTKRAIKILIAKPGLDGHDVGAKLVCRALMDAGMEVVYSGLRKSPEEIAAAANSEGVDAIGLSIMSGAHLPLTAKVAAALDHAGVRGRLLIVGGNIPKGDVPALEELGVARVFPVGSPFTEIVHFLEERVVR